MRSSRWFAACLLILASCSAAGGYWPQWRGPNRDNVSTETGLLKEWPEGGPPLSWEVDGIGEGIAGIAVAGGRVFPLGYFGGTEFLTALDERTGRRLWVAPIGTTNGIVQHVLMRWLMQRAPTVDEDRVYAFSGDGQLSCLDVRDGHQLWRRDYVEHLGGTRSPRGSCDYPLVDGDRLICVIGGPAPAMVALDKRTGRELWRSATTESGSSSYWSGEWGATVVSEVGGVRQYVAYMRQGLFGFRAVDGTLLWSYDRILTPGNYGYPQTPIVAGDSVIATSGWMGRLVRLKLVPCGEAFEAREEYALDRMAFQFTQDSSVLSGPHLYGVPSSPAHLICLEAATGKTAWKERWPKPQSGSFTCAEGRLYLKTSKGEVTLIEASPEKPVVKGRFQIGDHKDGAGATIPVVAGGCLYLRDEGRLFRYDVRGGARPVPSRIRLAPPAAEPPPPGRAVFVSTPQDVVERMLRLAGVTDKDLVYDLGSGDGRIVFTAARDHSAKAVGIEIDPELVRSSQKCIAALGLQSLVTIEQKDMYGVDLSAVSVVAVYLPEAFLEKLKPQLAKLPRGARIVSHQFRIPGFLPDRELAGTSQEDGASHTIYLYEAPFRETAK
ncbi:MAG: PQQ-binding-like beta-propeller repeat protein [Planctomycetes bacterium]|nr:PQQ-binding-like beta-propeller repeat protein [Planctomycetota bacterium]